MSPLATEQGLAPQHPCTLSFTSPSHSSCKQKVSKLCVWNGSGSQVRKISCSPEGFLVLKWKLGAPGSPVVFLAWCLHRWDVKGCVLCHCLSSALLGLLPRGLASLTCFIP